MSETDRVIRAKVISRENATISIPEFYKTVKNYLKKEKGYTDFNEKEYSDSTSNGLKSTKIKLEVGKKIDDYTKFKIEVGINMNNYKPIIVKGERLVKGNFKMEFNAFLENDYKGKWEDDFLKKFSRGLYDKFILGFHFNKLGDEVKEECLDLIDEVKSYMGMIK